MTTGSLENLVTTVASRLMPVNAATFVPVVEHVLQDLVEHFGTDTCFLRYNDHDIHATVLVAEWPRRSNVPKPDPLGVVYFRNADPIFAQAEHLKDMGVVLHGLSDGAYANRIREGSGVTETSIAAVPLLSGDVTTGTLGFIKFGDREWTEAETNVLRAIAALLAQVQARIEAEEQLRFSADHDHLTGLANRRALLRHLDQRLGPGGPGPVGVMFIDLDRLKPLNDFLGHLAGDEYIRQLAKRLSMSAGPDDLVARLGGDEFVIVLGEPVCGSMAECRAETFRQIVSERVQLGREVVSRSVSIGVAVGVPGQTSVAALLSRADQAAIAAKALGGNGIVVYTDDMQEAADKRNLIELSLRTSINDESLFLLYQPEVDLRSGQIIGVEALVRWNHPVLGLLQPASFIEVAESTNLAGELGRWVIRTACRQYAQWRSAAPELDLTLRVNVSPVQLVNLDFVYTVARVLEEFQMDNHALCLEVTENAVVSDLAQTQATLQGLDALGVRVAIDDFGTGYSSLSHLKALPVDELKIDKNFVMELDNNPDDRTIVRSIIGLAESFGLQLVAEGVENVEAARALLDMGCYRAQGFLFSRPVPAEEIEALLDSGRIDLALCSPADLILDRAFT